VAEEDAIHALLDIRRDGVTLITEGVYLEVELISGSHEQ
jgi:hypothetical protein